MSRLFGSLRQMGYVVKDIDAAMRHWIDVCQIGPWFYVDKLVVQDFTYKGQPSDPHLSIALANSGDVQLELIQQRDDSPTLYQDFLNAGNEGLQHFSTWPENYQEIYREALAAGYTVGQEADSPRGPFVYFEQEGHPGTVIEMAEMTEGRRRIFDGVREAAVDWDGSDPIRERWPS
ncbi:MAG: VOC family protein [Alphaproteobacteria bacterium]|nr:VOC family protein [Alphaproteobacteria bacterium]